VIRGIGSRPHRSPIFHIVPPKKHGKPDCFLRSTLSRRLIVFPGSDGQYSAPHLRQARLLGQRRQTRRSTPQPRNARGLPREPGVRFHSHFSFRGGEKYRPLETLNSDQRLCGKPIVTVEKRSAGAPRSPRISARCPGPCRQHHQRTIEHPISPSWQKSWPSQRLAVPAA